MFLSQKGQEIRQLIVRELEEIRSGSEFQVELKWEVQELRTDLDSMREGRQIIQNCYGGNCSG